MSESQKYKSIHQTSTSSIITWIKSPATTQTQFPPINPFCESSHKKFIGTTRNFQSLHFLPTPFRAKPDGGQTGLEQSIKQYVLDARPDNKRGVHKIYINIIKQEFFIINIQKYPVSHYKTITYITPY